MRRNDVVNIIKSGIDSQEAEQGEDGIFTRSEREYCSQRLSCLGARYIIKKCVLDYLTDEKGYAAYNYSEIEVVNSELGQPFLRLFSGVRECIHDLKIKDIFISISHSRNWITGMVLFCY